MTQVSIIGLDLAKNVFQVHGIDDRGKVLVRRSLRRAEVLAFFARCPPVSLAWKPVEQRITGRVN